MPKPNFKEMHVLSSHRITPNMQRVKLFSAELAQFPASAKGGYVKLAFDPATGKALNKEALSALSQRPTLRTYTIREFDPAQQTIDIDFVIHGSGEESGPASSWAVNCQVDDRILLGGPGSASEINAQADWLIFAGDMTALPAISTQLEKLPNSAKGVAIIEINHKDDKQDLIKPDDIEIIWVVSPNSLEEKVRQQAWSSKPISAWVASEFSSMKKLRMYFQRERELDRNHLYISSYWKKGFSEEQHKVAKKEDAERQ